MNKGDRVCWNSIKRLRGGFNLRLHHGTVENVYQSANDVPMATVRDDANFRLYQIGQSRLSPETKDPYEIFHIAAKDDVLNGDASHE